MEVDSSLFDMKSECLFEFLSINKTKTYTKETKSRLFSKALSNILSGDEYYINFKVRNLPIYIYIIDDLSITWQTH